ncbi:triphosphoribosyl-dephospho-CoA synthase MdcB [Massilia jejuensis]|uniref:Probable 2-(5''-triphosphoribosyl)-3'-dephosphocoenzyme-A synthase n=1 Tax=Massilia jejuensis TaxID=648894 RepID=A0ABW0PJ07_9BURK
MPGVIDAAKAAPVTADACLGGAAPGAGAGFARDPRERAGAAAPGAVRRPETARQFRARIARLAVRSLYAELSLYPKPGLVSLVDNGSHADMTAATFMRSMFALRHYFARITAAGADNAPFSVLAALGVDAERRMLRATAGINTHRGAIFGLGLLCAALGACHAAGAAPSAPVLRALLVARWGAALAAHARPSAADSHGTRVAARYAVGGARQEAALGMPAVFDVALPALRQALEAGRGARRARVDALFALMAHISDTNVYHRGGAAGAETVRRRARAFLAAGGSAAPDWEARARHCHAVFVARRLSPGGAADLLAAACLVQAATGGAW